MIALPPSTQVWLEAGTTDMRKSFDGLAALVQESLGHNPFSGSMFVFRGRRGDRIKVLWFSGDGLCLFAKRLEDGLLATTSRHNMAERSLRAVALGSQQAHLKMQAIYTKQFHPLSMH